MRPYKKIEDQPTEINLKRMTIAGLVLASLNTQIKALEADIAAQLAAHTDGHIFTSLPR